jgi:hypothetical protein
VQQVPLRTWLLAIDVPVERRHSRVVCAGGERVRLLDASPVSRAAGTSAPGGFAERCGPSRRCQAIRRSAAERRSGRRVHASLRFGGVTVRAGMSGWEPLASGRRYLVDVECATPPFVRRYWMVDRAGRLRDQSNGRGWTRHLNGQTVDDVIRALKRVRAGDSRTQVRPLR